MLEEKHYYFGGFLFKYKIYGSALVKIQEWFEEHPEEQSARCCPA